MKDILDLLLVMLNALSYLSLIIVVAAAIFVYHGGEINITYHRDDDESGDDAAGDS